MSRMTIPNGHDLIAIAHQSDKTFHLTSYQSFLIGKKGSVLMWIRRHLQHIYRCNILFANHWSVLNNMKILGLAAQSAAAGNSAISLPSRINFLSDTEDNEGPEPSTRWVIKYHRQELQTGLLGIDDKGLMPYKILHFQTIIYRK